MDSERMKTFRTAEIAASIGIHPNTVRFYEAQGLLPQVPRRENGYRVYSELHLLGLRLIRLAFKAEILSNHLRDEAVQIVKTSAAGQHSEAVQLTMLYQKHLGEEITRAQEAIALAEKILNRDILADEHRLTLGRREAACKSGISMNVLRDWERNGLISVPRKGNRRVYGVHETNRLKIITILRNADYSQMAIRRMMVKLDGGETDLCSALDTPENTEDIVSVADRYISSLTAALADTERMLDLLQSIS